MAKPYTIQWQEKYLYRRLGGNTAHVCKRVEDVRSSVRRQATEELVQKIIAGNPDPQVKEIVARLFATYR